MIYRKPSGFVKFTAGFNCSHVNLNSCEHCQQNNYSKPPGTVKKKKKSSANNPNTSIMLSHFHTITKSLTVQNSWSVIDDNSVIVSP